MSVHCFYCGKDLPERTISPGVYVWNTFYDPETRSISAGCEECIKNPLVGLLKTLEKSLTTCEQ